jgi:hypothetical protein
LVVIAWFFIVWIVIAWVHKKESLPPRLAGLPNLTAIVVASTASSATAEAFPAATTTPSAKARLVGFRLRFIHREIAPTQIDAVHRGNGLLGFTGVGHFDETKAAGASGFAIGHDADFLHRAMRFKSGPEFGLRRAMRQISHIEILHDIFSF